MPPIRVCLTWLKNVCLSFLETGLQARRSGLWLQAGNNHWTLGRSPGWRPSQLTSTSDCFDSDTPQPLTFTFRAIQKLSCCSARQSWSWLCTLSGLPAFSICLISWHQSQLIAVEQLIQGFEELQIPAAATPNWPDSYSGQCAGKKARREGSRCQPKHSSWQRPRDYHFPIILAFPLSKLSLQTAGEWLQNA